MHRAFTSTSAGTHVNTAARLSALNERFSLALESSRQIVFDWHIPDDTLYFSGELSTSLKAVMLDTAKAWSSSALPAIIHDEDKERFRRCLHDALKGTGSNDGAFYNIELRVKDSLRSWRWVNISGKIVERDGNGRAIRMTGTFSDIDERKQAENRISRLRDLYLVLSQINQAIVRLDESGALFRAICRIAVEHGRFRLAWIGTIDHESGHLAFAAGHGDGLELMQAVEMSIDPSGSEASSVVPAHANERTVCNDVSRDPRLEYCGQAASRSGIHSIARFPLQVSGRLLGVLNLYAAEAGFFDTESVDLIEEMARDISFAIANYERKAQRKVLESKLVDSEKFKSAILTAAPDCIVSINRNGEVIHFNQAAEITFGYRSEEVLGKPLADVMIPPERRQQHREAIAGLLATGESSLLNRRIELMAIRANGSLFPAELAIVPLSIDDNPIFTAFIRDISEFKRAEALQLGQNRILNMVATGASLSAILTEIARFAESQSESALCSILQLNADGTALVDGVAPSLSHSCASRLAETVVGPCSSSCGAAAFRATPIVVTDIAADPLWTFRRELALEHGLKACTSWPIFGTNGKKVLGTLALYFREAVGPTARDLQLLGICARLAGIAMESRASEERIRYLAHYDGLTSLPNRFLFKEYLDLALRTAQRHANKFAVLFLDLDKFKEINDTLGHDAGDQVLREIAKRMRNCVRHTDKIARMGGDEFYVLIEELSDGRHAAEVAQKLLDETARPVVVGDEECRLSVSIGIAIYPNDGKDGVALLKNADSAMYRAKDAGKNAYQFFSGQAITTNNSAALFRPSPLVYREEKKLMRFG